jgi:hypothetical protein
MDQQDSEEVPAYDAEDSRNDNSEFAKSCPIITIDGNLIYEVNPPAQALYELSDPKTFKLNFLTPSTVQQILFRLDGPRQDGANRWKKIPTDKGIYQLSRTTYPTRSKNTTTKGMLLHGRCKGGETQAVLSFSKHFGLNGCRWELEIDSPSNNKVLLRCWYKPFAEIYGGQYSWDDGKRQLAVETRTKGNGLTRPVLKIIVPLDQVRMDLLVATWAARVLYEKS